MAIIILTMLFLFFLQPSCAAEEQSAPPPVPGLEFTKIQDLAPNPVEAATNRPLKQKWALVVGASKFRESRLTPVEVKDMDESAREFYNYLIDQDAGRFDPKHVKLLLNSSATRQNIISALGPSWLGSVAGPDDLVVVYIATNAFPTTDGNTYLCAYDCALDNVFATCISMQTLMESLRKNVRTSRIVLVLQSAYSGAAELATGAKAIYSGFNIDLDKVMLGKGYVILSSSKPNEITWSTAFSKNLIASLRRENGLITLPKAFLLAKQQTEKETSLKSKGKQQTPVMKTDWSGNELVIGAPPAEKVSTLPDEFRNFLSAESYYLKATQLLSAGKIDESLNEYKNAINVNPNYADALADYGAALTLKNDWQNACKMYEKALTVQPEDALFHLNYARVLLQLGMAKESERELEIAYTLNPKDLTVLTSLASRTLATNRLLESVRYLNEALTLYPANADLHERLSCVLAKAGNLAEALKEARQAVQLDPRSISALRNLGTVLQMQGELEAAVDVYKQGLALSKEDPDLHYLLSRVLEKRGEKSAALLELTQFLRYASTTDPRLNAARQHLKDLSLP